MRMSDWSSDVCSSDLYRTVVACAKKPGAKKHTPPSRPARCESSRLKPLPQLCGQPPYRVAANRSNAPMPSSTVTRSITPSCSIFAPHFNSLAGLPRYLRLGGEMRTAKEQNARDNEAAVQRSEEHTSELQSLMRISYAVFCLQNKK